MVERWNAWAWYEVWAVDIMPRVRHQNKARLNGIQNDRNEQGIVGKLKCHFLARNFEFWLQEIHVHTRRARASLRMPNDKAIIGSGVHVYSLIHDIANRMRLTISTFVQHRVAPPSCCCRCRCVMRVDDFIFMLQQYVTVGQNVIKSQEKWLEWASAPSHHRETQPHWSVGALAAHSESESSSHFHVIFHKQNIEFVLIYLSNHFIVWPNDPFGHSRVYALFIIIFSHFFVFILFGWARCVCVCVCCVQHWTCLALPCRCHSMEVEIFGVSVFCQWLHPSIHPISPHGCAFCASVLLKCIEKWMLLHS